jgi:transposase, IS5 family
MLKGFFDIDFRMDALTKNGDPLVRLNECVNWEMFRGELEVIREKERKNNAGRKPFDAVMMFKVLVLQSLYNLSDDAMEYQIRDRLSFMRFLGLTLGDRVPDAKTIWLFREELGKAGLVKRLFKRFDRYLREHGFSARKGQIVDASIVSVPIQRNSREENGRIKDGEVPEDWSEAKRRQKDVYARWSARNHKHAYGYKNHISIDAKHKLIRDYMITDAAVHDSQVFGELLDETNTSRDVWADSAYRSEENLSELERRGYREHLHRKGCRHQRLTDWEKQGNRTRSRVRCRIEHVFGIQAQKAGNLILRTIGKIRAEVKIGLRNLAYNLYRVGRCMPAEG